MDLKIKPNLINLSKNGSTAIANENLKSKNLPKLDKSEILHDASNLASEINNESQSSLDVLKKQLEKLQKKLKEIDNAIKTGKCQPKSLRKRDSGVASDPKRVYICPDNAEKRAAFKDARRLIRIKFDALNFFF